MRLRALLIAVFGLPTLTVSFAAPAVASPAVSTRAHPPLHPRWHRPRVIVRPGMTLTQLSHRWRRTVAQIAAWNHIADPNVITVGEVIVKPPQRYVPPGVGLTDTAAVVSSAYQACVIQRESGGDPQAMNPYSGASGLYGFLGSTWEAVTGLDAPASAWPPSTQTDAFWKLYDADGSRPWVSDGC